MRAHERPAEATAETTAKARRTPATAQAGRLSPAAVLALQRAAGNRAVVGLLSGMGHGVEDEQPARSTVPDVLRSQGRPLDSGVRTEMEARFGGEDFSDVRVHSDAAARDSASEIDARAYTSGNHIVIGSGGADPHTLAHELTHVVQQRSGPVAGTDNGQGLSLSDPSDAFEREAEANARQIMAGRPSTTPQRAAGSSGGDPAVQRYVDIAPGASNYPTLHKKTHIGPDKEAEGDEEFFPSQHKEQDSYYGGTEPIRANIKFNSSVTLRFSDNFDLAVEHGEGESKVFFATKQHIEAANKNLAGRVRFDQGKRFLRIRHESGERQLFQAVPVVENRATELAQAGRAVDKSLGLHGWGTPKTKKMTGLSILTPQRCNEMAEFVTNKKTVSSKGITAWENFLAQVLDIVDNTQNHLEALTAAHAAIKAPSQDFGRGATADLIAYTQRMSRRFQELKDDDSPELVQALRQLGLNDFLPPPAPGSVMATVGYGDAQQEEERDKDTHFEYHFGAVVATSGDDYITMENYARRDPSVKDILSGGDPLFFFRMYGTKRELGETWHSYQSGTGGFIGAIISINLQS